MSAETLQQIEQEVKTLTPAEKLEVMEIVLRSLREESVEPKTKRSLLELRGLGKEIWQGVDATEYVRQERDSWDR